MFYPDLSRQKVLVVIIWILRGEAASNTWEIKMPENIYAVSGFCVQIPCQFEIPDSFQQYLNQSVEALWRKREIEGETVFSSANAASSLLKGHVTGNILKKDCTTVFHKFPAGFSDKYFLRIQGPNILKYTFDKGVNITVHKEFLPPMLSPYVQEMEVQEGTEVVLTCSTVISCPSTQPQMQWSSKLGKQLPPALKENEFGQTLLVSSQMFNATPFNDRLKVSCSLLYSHDPKRPVETSITLRVLYPPTNTIAVVSPPGPVSEGYLVVLSCQSNANPAVHHYEWYKYNGSGVLVLQNRGQNLTMTARTDVQGPYVCVVYNEHGTDQSRPVTVEIKSCQCSIAPYILCGFLTLVLILITAVDLVKYKSLLKRLQASQEMGGPVTYATLNRTSDSVYNVIQTGGSRTEEDYENRQLSKH